MSDFISGNVLCPFYKDVKPKKQQIICEGFIGGSSLLTSFRSKNKMNNHLQEFCCDRYKECVIAEALYRKYERK